MGWIRILRLIQLSSLFYAIIVLDLLFHRAVDGRINHTSNDAEIVIGSQLIIRCQTDNRDLNDPIEWHFQSNEDSPFFTLYKSGMIFRYQVEITVSYNISSGLSELVIPSVSLNHAGTYVCLDDDSQRKSEIVVLERYPSEQYCSMMKPPDYVVGINRCSIEPDQIQLSCQLRYRGNLKPYLEWFVKGDRKISSTNITSNGIITSTVVWKADELQSPTFSCRLKYEDNKITSNFIWNRSVPVLTMLDSSTIVKVNYDTSQLNCSGGEYFGCKCHWIDESDKPVATGSVLLFADLADGHYRAIATRSIREKPCSFVSEQIIYNSGKVKFPSSEDSKVVLIVVMSTSLMINLVIAVLITSKKSKQRKLQERRKAVEKILYLSEDTNDTSERPISEHGENPKFRLDSSNEKEGMLNNSLKRHRVIGRTVSVPCFSPIQAST